MSTQTGKFEITFENWAKRFLILSDKTVTPKYVLQKTKDPKQLQILLIQAAAVSSAGRARYNGPAIAVLAACFIAGDEALKVEARTALPSIVRTGTHLFILAEMLKSNKKWSSSIKKAIGSWFEKKSPSTLAYQTAKYKSREGWTHKDLLRLCHLKPESEEQGMVFKYLVKGYIEEIQGSTSTPEIIHALEEVKDCGQDRALELITTYNLAWEHLPTEYLSNYLVWNALFPGMRHTALMRNLGRLSSLGLTSDPEILQAILSKFNDAEWVKQGMLHPVQLLVAKKQYAVGMSRNLVWKVEPAILAALEAAFYHSFQTITPSGKNRMLAVDVSGSMDAPCPVTPVITCREAAAVMAMVTARVEPWSKVFGFDNKFRDLRITPGDTLEQVCKKTYSPSFSSTNCGLPIVTAMENKWNIDVFEVYTDCDFNTGRSPTKALAQYRANVNPDARFAAIAIERMNFSITDPNDMKCLEVVGFDTATPSILAEFAAGNL